MNGERQRRLAARFARAWKREVRADEGLRHKRENLEAREKQLVPGLSKRFAMLIMIGVAATILVILLIYGR